MVEVKKELITPCGLYCGVCAVYIAHRDNNLKFKTRIIPVYPGIAKEIDDISCTGCLSDGILFPICRTCSIKNCCSENEIEGCYQCEEFPCDLIQDFPLPVGKKVIMRAIPFWKEHGTDKFVEEEEKRYHCPNCNNPLFRGAKRCNVCKIEIDID